jgi:outer membrane immunogenic protein
MMEGSMNRILILGAAIAGLSSGMAAAADLPVKIAMGPDFLAPPPFSWTGFYIGINGGGAWSDNAVSYSQIGTAGAASTRFNDKSAIGGAQAGFNWRLGPMVVGIETDFDGRHWTRSVTTTPLAGNTIDLVTLTQTENWLATARGRIGVAFGDALIYATAGAAAGEVEHSVTEFRITTGQTRILTDSPTRVGWVAGGGLEYRVWYNLSVGVEYLHVDLGNTTLANPASVVAGLAFAPSQATFTDRSDIIRAKLNWLFGWQGPRVY